MKEYLNLVQTGSTSTRASKVRRNEQPAISATYIGISPPVLILCLSRFENGRKISQDRVGIDLKGEYTVTICREGAPVKVFYRVVCRTGTSILVSCVQKPSYVGSHCWSHRTLHQKWTLHCANEARREVVSLQ